MDATGAAWVSAATSIVLACITGWYAWLTRRLAKSSEASAASAERAARIAADALAASVAGLDVNFAIRPNFRSIGHGSGVAAGVTLWCRGATVFVHRVHLESMSRLDGRHADDGGSSYTRIAADRALVIDDMLNPAGLELPLRLHRDEVIHFDIDPQVKIDGRTTVGIIELSVWYSLNNSGELMQRRVDHYDTD
jgi:hypothetical protein